jgi:GNAT superfamily N-acetyltransferase
VSPDRILLLRDGSEVRMRPATDGDAPLVAALHARCAPHSRRSRFLSPTRQLAPAELEALLGEGSEFGRAVLAVTADGGSAVGIANLDGDGVGVARAAILVEDAWQGRGLGTALLRRMAETATEQGVTELTGVARADDLGVTRLLRRAGLRPCAEIVGGEVHLRAPLPAPVA